MQNWQQQLAQAITDPRALCAALDLDFEQLREQLLETPSFVLRAPEPFVKRMKKGNLNDPLLLQVLPQAREQLATPGYSQDPLLEKNTNPIPGLLHKYHGRVLLTLTGACAIHCRYCFRRHFPYHDNASMQNDSEPVLDYIRAHPDIEEIILSGGDPLVVKDEQLHRLIQKLSTIRHLKTLRIHTRLPIVIPDRITKALTAALTDTRLNTLIVLHCNHPQEIDSTVIEALNPLKHSPVTLLNQSVLLKSINDCEKTLITLSQRLLEAGALPYYLHLLDPVEGSAHFDVSETAAKSLLTTMRENLPGYLVPKLVREIPGAPSKMPVL